MGHTGPSARLSGHPIGPLTCGLGVRVIHHPVMGVAGSRLPFVVVMNGHSNISIHVDIPTTTRMAGT